MRINDFFNSVNVDLNGFRIDDIAEKVGFLLFGEVGRAIGKAIDNVTKDITLELGSKKDE